jgi:N-glycosylase/DNA lyase
MTEENDPNKRRKIVNRFLIKLTQEEPQMYYATTSEVARSIHTMIKEHTNRLSVEEQALVRGITIEDIQGMLGFNLK